MAKKKGKKGKKGADEHRSKAARTSEALQARRKPDAESSTATAAPSRPEPPPPPDPKSLEDEWLEGLAPFASAPEPTSPPPEPAGEPAPHPEPPNSAPMPMPPESLSPPPEPAGEPAPHPEPPTPRVEAEPPSPPPEPAGEPAPHPEPPTSALTPPVQPGPIPPVETGEPVEASAPPEPAGEPAPHPEPPTPRAAPAPPAGPTAPGPEPDRIPAAAPGEATRALEGSRRRGMHPFALVLLALVVVILAYAALRLGTGESLDPETAAVRYVGSTFQSRRELAIRRGTLARRFLVLPEAPASELSLEELLDRLRRLDLVEIAVERVAREETLASVRLRLVHRDRSTEAVEVVVSRVDGRWGVVVDPARPLRFGWESELERRLPGLRAAEAELGREVVR